MSKIFEQVEADIKTALKQKDTLKLEALRGIKTAFVAAQTEKNAKPFDDAKAVEVLTKLKKQRNEAALLYAKGGRLDLETNELAEAEVISEYLPAEASLTEVSNMVLQSLQTCDHNMGVIIKDVKAKLVAANLSFDGGRLSGIVKSTLDNLK